MDGVVEKYRHPIEVDVRGTMGDLDPEGVFPRGSAAHYDEIEIVPPTRESSAFLVIRRGEQIERLWPVTSGFLERMGKTMLEVAAMRPE